MPKVSVIVPVYGVEQYIERCARSLFEQTLEDIEYVFVDDCTKDKSIEILQKVLENYPNKLGQTKIVRHELNKGLPVARQTGIKIATGEYIAHCDSDDWVDKDMYRQMYERAIEVNADIVICDYYKASNDKQKCVKGCYSTDNDQLIKDFLTERIGWSVWNKLIKNSLYHNNEICYPKDNMGEDMALIIPLILTTQNVSYVPKPLYYYYFNPSSITHHPSVEAVYKRYMQLANNTKIVLSSFAKAGCEKRYKGELRLLKWYVRRSLWPITNQSKYHTIWCKTYPEIFPAILCTNYLKVPYKLMIIATYLRLYPHNNTTDKTIND